MAEEGVQFLTSTRPDWTGTTYTNHLTWHLSLYHLGVSLPPLPLSPTTWVGIPPFPTTSPLPHHTLPTTWQLGGWVVGLSCAAMDAAAKQHCYCDNFAVESQYVVVPVLTTRLLAFPSPLPPLFLSLSLSPPLPLPPLFLPSSSPSPPLFLSRAPGCGGCSEGV